jgi:hypothetical protein
MVEKRRSRFQSVGHGHSVDLDHEVFGNPHGEVRREGALDSKVTTTCSRDQHRV